MTNEEVMRRAVALLAAGDLDGLRRFRIQVLEMSLPPGRRLACEFVFDAMAEVLLTEDQPEQEAPPFLH